LDEDERKENNIMNIDVKTVTANVGANPISFETGKMAKLADGAVVVTSGETTVLVTSHAV